MKKEIKFILLLLCSGLIFNSCGRMYLKQLEKKYGDPKEPNYEKGYSYHKVKDYENELKYYLIGEQKGEGKCINALGYIYANGNAFVKKDFEKGVRYYTLYANRYNKYIGYEELGDLYSNTSDDNRNNGKAVEWYLAYVNTSSSGNYRMLNKIGNIYRIGGYGVFQDLDRAKKYYKMSCDETPGSYNNGCDSLKKLNAQQ